MLKYSQENNRFAIGLIVLMCAWTTIGCEQRAVLQTQKDDSREFSSRLLGADSEKNNWLMHGRTYDEQRYSPLTQINSENISNLSLEWFIDLPESRGQESTPLIVDGVIFASAAWSMVFALDAKTGKEIWHFDPKVPRSWGIRACCDAVNRGVAYWDELIVFGTLDGRLIGLDAVSGSEIWSVNTIDTEEPYSITGAPRIVNGKVFIGNGGAEFGVRGYVSAYDVLTGDLIWRFFTVPGNPDEPFENDTMQMAAETWSGNWWELGGGGTVWDSMSYDAKYNLLYVGTGNGSPWNPKLRSGGKGDNLFLSSIVALNADTGEYVWHYQTTPGEGWDYTATQHMILADIDIAGEKREVIMQAPKNGFFYVLDRKTGELISAEAFVDVNWATGIDLDSGRPKVRPEAKYWETGEVSVIAPAWSGGHSWHPMSFSPDTGLVYIPAQEMAFPYYAKKEMKRNPLGANHGIDTTAAEIPDDEAIIESLKNASSGHLLAWDPVSQKEVWRSQYKGILNGGVVSTAGNLVLQGNGAGLFQAFRADNGELLWKTETQTGTVAPPVTYLVDGEQYITVVAGWGGIVSLMTGPINWNEGEPINRSRILTYKLGGRASLPELNDVIQNMPDLSEVLLKPEEVREGFTLYEENCVQCHGAGAVGGGVIKDLRFSRVLQARDSWREIVVEGILKGRGMIGFGSVISSEEAELMRQYVIGRNQFAHSIGDTTRILR